MQLEKHANAEAVARRAADLVGAVVAQTADAVLVLPAGQTPIPVYRELCARVERAQLDLSRAHVFQLDELVGVAPTDRRSFCAFLREHLLDSIAREPGRDHLLDGTAADPAQELAAHAARLAELGGAGLALLGLGRNGHVAFNEPGSTLADGARMLDLAPATRAALAADFDDAPPALGTTLGLRDIAAARELVLLVTGSSKRAVLRALLDGAPTSALPASLLPRDRLTILADENALGS